MRTAARMTVSATLGLSLLFGTVALADDPPADDAIAGPLTADGDSPKIETEPVAPRIVDGHAKIDPSQLDSRAWKDAIWRAKQYPALQAGGQVTLLRVMQDTSPAVGVTQAIQDLVAQNTTPLVGPSFQYHIDLRPFIAASHTLPPEFENIQMTSVKLVGFNDFPNGGGMFRQCVSGDFVLVEHINSSRRKENRDPVSIASLGYQQVMLGVPVPERGTLGVAGDVVLSPARPNELGRLVVKLVFEGDTTAEGLRLRLGPLVVGGPYGKVYEFDANGICSIDYLSPGEYKVLLPDFDLRTSRWDTTIKPREMTYLRFAVDTQKKVKLQHENHAPMPSSD